MLKVYNIYVTWNTPNLFSNSLLTLAILVLQRMDGLFITYANYLWGGGGGYIYFWSILRGRGSMKEKIFFWLVWDLTTLLGISATSPKYFDFLFMPWLETLFTLLKMFNKLKTYVFSGCYNGYEFQPSGMLDGHKMHIQWSCGIIIWQYDMPMHTT